MTEKCDKYELISYLEQKSSTVEFEKPKKYSTDLGLFDTRIIQFTRTILAPMALDLLPHVVRYRDRPSMPKLNKIHFQIIRKNRKPTPSTIVDSFTLSQLYSISMSILAMESLSSGVKTELIQSENETSELLVHNFPERILVTMTLPTVICAYLVHIIYKIGGSAAFKVADAAFNLRQTVEIDTVDKNAIDLFNKCKYRKTIFPKTTTIYSTREDLIPDK